MHLSRSWRRGFSAVLMIGLLVTPARPAFAAPGDELTGSPYQTAVSAMYEAGMLTSDWLIGLRPSQLLTRAEEAQLLSVIVLGESSAGGFVPLRFPDVPATHWAKPYIDAAVWLRLMPGTSGAAFRPGDPVTTGQFATDVLRLCGAAATSASAAWNEARARDLTDSTTASQSLITRGEAILLIYRAAFGLLVPKFDGTLAQRLCGQSARLTPAGEIGPTLEVHLLPGNVALVRFPSGADWLIEAGPSWTMESTAAYLKGIGIEHIDVLLATSEQSSPSPVVHELSHRFPLQTILRLDVLRAAGRSLPAGLLSSDPDVTLELITVPGRAGTDRTAFRLTRSGHSILLTAGMTTDEERGLLTASTAAAVEADYWRAATLPPFTSRDPRLLQAIDPTHLIVDGGESELMLTAYATAGIGVSDPVRERSVVVSFGATEATVRTMCPTPPNGMTLAGLTDDSYYHGLSCARLRWLPERSLRWFIDARDAQLRGFRPCPLCGGR